MKNFSLLTIGDINLDLLVRVKRFPGVDDEVEAQAMTSYAGGDAANVAAQAARLGMRTAIIASVGNDDAGRVMKLELQRLGVDVSAVQTSSKQNTGRVIAVVREDGQRNLITYRGANTDLVLTDAHRVFLDAALVIHLSDPLPQVVSTLPGLLKDAEKEISLDPGAITATRGLDALMPILGLTKYFFCNENELKLLTGAESPEKGAEIILNSGPDFVFLKRGSEGCWIFTPSGQISVRGFDVDVVDTTGSGDAFDAGMLYALTQNMPLQMAARFANAVGGLTAQAVGSQTSQPDLRHVLDFISGD